MLLAWRSRISHPLKSLLYIEWLLMLIALLHPWLAPLDALAIISQRDHTESSISVGIGISGPFGWLLPIGWLVSCLVCWFVPKSNKAFITFILASPIGFVGLTGLVGRIPMLSNWSLPIPALAVVEWLIFLSSFAGFIWLGTQILQQQTALNQWLYTIVEVLLIWYIFFLVSAIGPTGKLHLETLLLLHLVALMRACLMFVGKQRRLVIAVLVGSYQTVTIVIGMVWPQMIELDFFDLTVTLQPNDIRQVANGFIYNVTVVFTLVTILLITLVNTLVSERRNREQLAQAHNQLRQYAQRIEDQTMLEERNRIAREIHDALGHTLTAQSIQLENALVHFEPAPDRAYQFLCQAKQLSHTALQEVRRSVSQLRSHLLAGKSFDTAISDLIAEFQQTYACTLDYDCDTPSIGIPIEVQTTCYRILQEALTNIARHSGADLILIKITTDAGIGTDDRTLRLQIVDNGRGFRTDQTTSGFGLQGIRERSGALAGQLQIQSAPGQGCQLQLTVPIRLWFTPSASLSSMIKP